MTARRPSPTDRARPERRRRTSCSGLVAFLARLLPTLRGGGLSGLGVYDDAVYYSGAAALVAGRVPYADFVLLHPPGVVLALAPFAALGRLTSDPAGFAAARVAFMALGVLNTVLVARLARRFGLVAAVVAGLFYALWYPAAAAEARTMIEPLGTLVVLLCLVLLLPREGVPSRRATVVAGVLLGLSLGLKIWAVAPVAVVVLWQLVVAGRAATARLLAGVLAGAAAIWVPFLLLAPGPMVRMVVADQVGRPRMGVTHRRAAERRAHPGPPPRRCPGGHETGRPGARPGRRRRRGRSRVDPAAGPGRGAAARRHHAGAAGRPELLPALRGVPGAVPGPGRRRSGAACCWSGSLVRWP